MASRSETVREDVSFSLIALEWDKRPTSESPGNHYSYSLHDITDYRIDRYPYPDSLDSDIQKIKSYVTTHLGSSRPYECGFSDDPLNKDRPPYNPLNHGAQCKQKVDHNFYPLERAAEQSVQGVGTTLLFAMRNDTKEGATSVVLERDELQGKCIHWVSGSLFVYDDAKTYNEIFGTSRRS